MLAATVLPLLTSRKKEGEDWRPLPFVTLDQQPMHTAGKTL